MVESRESSRSQIREAKSEVEMDSSRTWGYACVLGVVLTWVAQSEMAQYLQTKASYNKPYFIVYINHSFMALMLPIQALWHMISRRSRQQDAEQAFDPLLSVAPTDDVVYNTDNPQSPRVECRFGDVLLSLLARLGVRKADVDSRVMPISIDEEAFVDHGGERVIATNIDPNHVEKNGKCNGASTGNTMTLAASEAVQARQRGALLPWTLVVRAAWLCVIYTLGDWFWYIGLPHISVASGTCIFNSSCVFVYLFSVVFLGEKVAADRIAAVTLALVGVVILAIAPSSNNAANTDSSGSSSTAKLVGSTFVLVAAILYALYEVLCERFVFRGSESTALANTLSGIVGILNVVLLWPLIPVLSVMPSRSWGEWVSEPFQAPDAEDTRFIMINALLALMFNIFFMLAIALTSPLITSVGCMLTIPVSAACDWLLYGDDFSSLAWAGSALVVLGFALLTRADLRARASHDV